MRLARGSFFCAALGAPFALGLLGSCTKKAPVGLTVLLPAGVAPTAAWVEVAAFAGACPDSALLAAGLPPEGEVLRIAFPAQGTSPSLGDLARGSYAFAAAARAADCSVIASGCSVVDVGSAHSVTLTLAAADTPVGACGAASTCDAARCVPSVDIGNPTVGAGCSLQLLGAGPLGDALSSAGTLLGAPAVAATSAGFLVAYREWDPVTGAGRLTLVPVDNGGGALAGQATTLPGRCATSPESDAVAMSFSGPMGLVVLARAPCDGLGGLDLFQIDATGTVSKSGFSGAGASILTLAPSRALAPTPGSGSFLLAFDQDGQTQVVEAAGVGLGSVASPFGGTPPQLGGWIATSDSAVALLAASAGAAPPDGGTVPPGSALALQLAPDRTNLGAGPAITLAGAWGALAASGTRVVVVSPGPAGGNPVVWTTFDVGQATASATDGITTRGTGPALFADVAIANDRALLAIEQQGSISLAAIDHITAVPLFNRQVFVPDDPRVPSMTTVRDGRIALAASGTRVALAWTTARALGDNEVVGGYAIYACAP